MRLIRLPDSNSFDLHLSRRARDYYRLDDVLRLQDRSASEFQLARMMARVINERRDTVRNPALAVEPGWINAAWTYADIVIDMIDAQSGGIGSGLQSLESSMIERLGTSDAQSLLDRFVTEFPPTAVYRGVMSSGDYLEGETAGIPNRRVLLQDLLIVWLFSQNRAFRRFSDLFDISGFVQPAIFKGFSDAIRDELSRHPSSGQTTTKSLLDMLLEPAELFPDSLDQQFEYIRKNWKRVPAKLERRVLSALDMMSEEHKPVFGPGPGPAEIPVFEGLESEPERFSPDLDWMPRLVLLAKNAYVWLDQLSRQYGKPIRTLDAVPEAELRVLSLRGITGLWLIGVWERSRASKTIKRLCGNPDAEASAYSLIDYVIAEDLGGETAFETLKVLAWTNGIRLAGDMVPNHMGIDSSWVIQHPERFVHTRSCPFPSYSFTGPDLSPDPNYQIQIEDHYFDRTDASVVFQRTDRRTGEVMFIYHGNDGTVMPWNDTAQLDYLNPETRAEVSAAILRVARRFPIIRFDAAMTLAKRHYQRLWFPEPGTGGSIPSRAEHSLTKDAFNAAMPEEFWREIVDRIAAEAPDTLLLAEAFWLMEGYFVRTLGMHRVYNSAFMNMLRDELNAQYRSVITNTLEFDSDVLKRYVNFMNNPDEKTAVEQFGKFSKYFGVCVMLATLPGLPMFGHGQFEGFTEKYGMEYRRAYRNEQPDRRFMRYHDRIISPLLHKRRLFADADQFRLYDMITPSGSVDQNVYAYSNQHGDAPSLVIFNNRNGRTRGRIQHSTPVRAKRSDADSSGFIRTELHHALGLRGGSSAYCIWREQVSGLQFIHPSDALIQNGFAIELAPYDHRVFLDIYEVVDDASGFYEKIADYLGGRGTWELGEVAREIEFRDVLRPFRDVLVTLFIQRQSSRRKNRSSQRYANGSNARRQRYQRIRTYFRAICTLTGLRGRIHSAFEETVRRLHVLTALSGSEGIACERSGRFERGWMRRVTRFLHTDPMRIQWLVMWSLLSASGRLAHSGGDPEVAGEWVDEWLLGRLVMRRAMEWEVDEDAARRLAAILRALVVLDDFMQYPAMSHTRWSRFGDLIAGDSEIRWIIGANEFDGVVWINKEAWEELMDWLRAGMLIRYAARHRLARTRRMPGRHLGGIEKLANLAEDSEYRLDRLLDSLSRPASQSVPAFSEKVRNKGRKTTKKSRG